MLPDRVGWTRGRPDHLRRRHRRRRRHVDRVPGVLPARPGRRRTRERVLAVAAELGYRPNPHARALLSGRHHTVAMVVSDITNPHYFELIRGAELRARVSEYTLVLVNAEESPRVEWDQIQRLVAAVDGFVLAASRLPDENLRADRGPAPRRPHEPRAARAGQRGARPRRGVPADRRSPGLARPPRARLPGRPAQLLDGGDPVGRPAARPRNRSGSARGGSAPSRPR